MNNYEWYLEKDLSNYSNKWVAIFDENIIASDEDLDKLTSKVSERFPLENVSFVKIPSKAEALVYKC